MGRRLGSVALGAALLSGCSIDPLTTDLGTEGDIPPGEGKEAEAAFDGKSNGFVDDATFAEDREEFDEVEVVATGLGPLFNAQSCRECHQQPLSGGGSQVTELRAGHRDAQGRFQPPRVPIARGEAFVEGRTLINDRAICPSGEFPDHEITEHVPESETIRTERLSISVLGDGLVEAVPDAFLRDYAARQAKETGGKIAGLVVEVPVLEAPGTSAVGRFGWKDQHASLLSFSADAYLNEMGITSRLQPDEVTTLCDTVEDPEDEPEGEEEEKAKKAGDGDEGGDEELLADIDRFARFMRSTKAPARDATLAASEGAKRGSKLFDSVGCATCHTRTLLTAPAGTKIHGGAFVVPEALGSRLFHPFSDFLLHDVGTGDGIAIAVQEHHGKAYLSLQPKMDATAPRLRTAPLWGVRLRSRLMHDGLSLTLPDAIARHAGEADDARRRFEALSVADREALLTFLKSL